MTFLSLPFLLLFVVTFGGLCLFPKRLPRQLILLAASYVFYAYWDVRFLGLLLLQTGVVYGAALLLARKKETSPVLGRVVLIGGLGICLGTLGFFKYFHFFTDSISDLLGIGSFSALTIILPVGISFYTFQSISYLVDVYRGKVTARKSFLKVALYIAFFPQLVAGPIVRSGDFLPQLDENPVLTLKNFQEGCQIFLFGAIKKAVIADRLSVAVDAVFAAPAAYSGVSIWLAVLAYSLQIYCDFSGYSDMALGVAKALGYSLPKNFNLPYLSANLTEFWKRWHISLSQWLQDYLYISLGGNRKGKLRTYVNLLLTMTIGGLWHGASWNFVVWGLLHGLGLIAHKLFVSYRRKKHPDCALKQGGPVSILSTYLFVCLCWVFFRSTDLSQAMLLFQRMFTLAPGISYIYVYTILFAIFFLALHIFCFLRTKREGFYPLTDWNKFLPKLYFVIALLLTLAFAYHGNQAFIYFQF